MYLKLYVDGASYEDGAVNFTLWTPFAPSPGDHIFHRGHRWFINQVQWHFFEDGTLTSWEVKATEVL